MQCEMRDVVGQLDLLTDIRYAMGKDPWNEVDPKCHVKPG
jgi:hypothetical protein